MKNRSVSATEFKAKCLAILDEVHDRGDVITVTKRGKPVATIQPVKKKKWKSPEGMWAGRAVEVEDLSKVDMAGLWNAVRGTEEL